MDVRVDEGAVRDYFHTLRTRQASLDGVRAASLRLTGASLPHGDAHRAVGPDSFRTLAGPSPDAPPTRVAAVDGGSALLHDAGTALVGARRAGFVVYEGTRLAARAVGPVNVSLLTEANVLAEVRDACAEAAMGEFALPSSAPTLAEAHDALRGLEEWRAARDALTFLDPGDTLLLDGALQAGPGKPWGILAALLDGARRRGVRVLALSKTSGLGVDGRVPLAIVAARLAEAWGVRAPWALPALPRDALVPEARGDVLVVRLAPETRDAYRVDASRDGEPFEGALAALRAVMPHVRDAAYVGYPYPLARVHHDVAFTPDLVRDCAWALRDRAARLGVPPRDLEDLFGDRHRILDVNR